jgi:hypothetical protein
MMQSTIKAKCHTEGCGTIRGFCFDLDRAEAGRLQRKVLAVAGWLVLVDQTYCPDCKEMLRIALDRMSRDQARQVKAALSDALHWSRVEVAGV